MTTRHHACAKTLALLALPLLISSCAPSPGATGNTGAAGSTTTTRANCGIDVTVTEPPRRIYAAYQPAIEVAHALGASDRLVGTAYLDSEVLPEHAAAQEETPYVESLPSRDELLAAQPDFILAGFNGVFSEASSSSIGTRASLAPLGISTWILSPLCPSTDGLADEAIDPATVTFDSIYADLRDLGELWGTPEQASTVVTDMQDRIAAVAEAVDSAPRPTVAVVSPRADGTLGIASGTDFVTRIIEAAGGTNVFADLASKRNITIGEEELLARDPDVILTSTCCDASYTEQDALPDVARLRDNPALATLTAVRDDQVHPFLFADRAASVRAASATEKVAAILHPGLVED
ncbi:ABC transporter substrate-binding protein [Lolliginicoccus suaedae]|uniref:ABC transporter substrate-binding protein n=1 Tax=Lolliginicoccus suaedae TaxID=2605429 RepID=UPI0016591FBF|nr:ABC transporter substrate-binding protein [Lolliginicoccus suaedae]